ncbi:MAG: hypothetical protein L0Z48_12360 [candidate division Zixibacteria bacterium]|nr:hypothetical protein [candidate division Zixibacteria bacterium]MCI0597315.1 hypothetical protein [candidate division Zixibacteria bacterium]
MLSATVAWAKTQPTQSDRYITTSNRLPEGMIINRIAKPQPVVYSPDLLSNKKPSNWEQILPLAKTALTPYNLDWTSFNSGGASFGTSATRHLGYSVGQSVAGEGSSGSNNLGIGFWHGTGAACSVYCPPGAVAEGEACYLPGLDVTNGGCNSSPEVFSLVNCGDTICGTAEAESGIRDTDWYLHRFTSDTIVTWKVVAEFPPAIFILDVTAGCAGLNILAFNSGNACDTVQLTADLSAGDYVFFVAPNVFDGFACVDGPHDYVAWLDCVPNCAQCPLSGIAEGEPCLETDDTFNGGCNSAPPVYSPINIGDTVCGTAFINDTLRDTDWYEKVLVESTVVRWCAVAEFPVNLFTLDGTGGCGGLVLRKFASADSCDTATIIDTLPPGTFWFFVAPDFAASGGYFCADGPHKYTAWLVEACAAAKGDLNGVGGFSPADVVLMLRCVFNADGTGTITGTCDLCFADVNCDGNLTPSDVVLELNRVFAGSTAPPWCGGP